MVFDLNIILFTALAFILTLITIFIVRQISKKVGLVDSSVGLRRLHNFDVPKVGVALFLSFLIVVLLINRSQLSAQIIGLLIGCLVITAAGLLDDFFDLSSSARMLFQLLAAVIVISVGIRVDVIGNFGNGNDGLFSLGFFSIPFTIIWIVGVTNAIRLLDGLDGLAGGVVGIASWALGVVSLMTGRYDPALLSFVLGAVAFAYLPYNFSNNKKIKSFMSDSGSNFLGFAIAVISIMGASKTTAVFSMIIPIIILIVPIFDTIFAIVRRLIAGKSPFEADRLHLHHRIMDSGVGHRRTTYIIYGITLLLGAFSIILTGQNGRIVVAAFIVIVALFSFILWKLGFLKSDMNKK